MAFVFGGVLSGERLSGHVISIFAEILGVGFVVAGYALAVRLFYLKGRVSLSDVRSLKR
jgi:NADH:ubiquinone oxidoreductase subunit K